mmetsp:Transcript_79591/g.209043  ORF Transcript_79591/g.209043 Transcript_79591/m.209043 type:complete len:201 (-) Transcript_79591:29-631(-)
MILKSTVVSVAEITSKRWASFSDSTSSPPIRRRLSKNDLSFSPRVIAQLSLRCFWGWSSSSVAARKPTSLKRSAVKRARMMASAQLAFLPFSTSSTICQASPWSAWSCSTVSSTRLAGFFLPDIASSENPDCAPAPRCTTVLRTSDVSEGATKDATVDDTRPAAQTSATAPAASSRRGRWTRRPADPRTIAGMARYRRNI